MELRACFAAVALVGALACSEAPEPPPDPGAPPSPAADPVDTDWGGGDAAAGAALFATHCATCHGGDGSGDGPAAVALNPKPRDFRDGTFYVDADGDDVTGEDVDLARVILEGPGAFGASIAMQGWREAFSDDEVRDLVAFVRTLER